MKRALLIAAVLLLVAGGLQAQTYVSATKHNLTNFSGSTGTQVCVYCHTPHGGSTTASEPLWNRTTSSATYTLYSAVAPAMTINQPGTGSTVCLSCHDGTVALNTLINVPGSSYDGSGGGSADTGYSYAAIDAWSTELGYFGTDLSGEHPVGVDYTNAGQQATEFDSQTNAEADGITFYSTDRVECGSCHDPHQSAANAQPFLRISNASSAMCLACHLK